MEKEKTLEERIEPDLHYLMECFLITKEQATKVYYWNYMNLHKAKQSLIENELGMILEAHENYLIHKELKNNNLSK